MGPKQRKNSIVCALYTFSERGNRCNIIKKSHLAPFIHDHPLTLKYVLENKNMFLAPFIFGKRKKMGNFFHQLSDYVML